AFVYGISSGAALALEAAAADIGVRRVAVYEPPLLLAPGNGTTMGEHAATLRALAQAGKRSAAVRYFMCDVVGMPRPMAWLMRLAPMWKKLKAVAHTLPYDATLLAGENGEGVLPRARYAAIAVPVLAMSGARSPAMLRDAAHAVAQCCPQAIGQVLEGQGHNVAAARIAPLLIEVFGDAMAR